jgi:hypothetical protein
MRPPLLPLPCGLPGRLTAAGLACALALAAAPLVAGPAVAAEQRPHPDRPAAAAARTGLPIRVSGVIVSSSGNTVQVLASSLRVGKQASTGARLVNLTLNPPARRRAIRADHHGETPGLPPAPPAPAAPAAPAAPKLTPGDGLTVTGTGTADGPNLTVTPNGAPVETAAPVRVWLGVLTGVDAAAGTVQLMAIRHSDGDGDHRDGRLHRLTAAAAAATVTLDGAASTLTGLAAGQVVVVLGSSDHDVATASSIYAFGKPPAFQGGRVTAVNGSVVSLDSDGPLDVDLAPGGTAIPLVLNGNAGATVDKLTPGARLLLVGTRDAITGFTPTMAFGFDAHDRGPVGHNED